MTFQIITTVLVPASSYDLTDLATVKDELSIPATDTGNDTFLARALSQASTTIANYCNRVFQVETVRDLIYIGQDPYPYQVPGGVAPLQLSRWPLAAVNSVVQNTTPGNPTTLVEGTDFKTDAVNGALINISTFTGLSQSWPALPVTVEYVAGYTVPVRNEAATVPASGQFTVTVAKVALFAADNGVVYASSGLPLVKVTANPLAGQYSVAAGVYTFNAADAAVAVLISYAVAQIPLDIVDATLRLITARFKARGRDPMLKSDGEPGLGQQQYWIGTAPGQTGSVAPEIAGILDNYRVPVIG